MKKLLITLLLISPFSFADWGDVYYCEMTANSVTTIEGERTNYKLEKFKFKLDKAKNAMVFGKGNPHFSIPTLEIETGWMPSKEVWATSNNVALSYFKNGKFMFTLLGTEDITAISANCDKF